MISILRGISASLALAVAVGFPQISSAEDFTGHRFLAWSKAEQDGFLTTSITMSAVIAAQIAPDVSQCIDQWYNQNSAVRAQRNDEIRHTVRPNASYHPSGVIYAVLTKQCGAFK